MSKLKEQGIQKLEQKKYKDAIKFFDLALKDRAEEGSDHEEELLHLVAEAYLKNDENKTCVYYCTQLLKQNPNSIKALTIRRSAYEAMGNAELSSKDLSRINELCETDGSKSSANKSSAKKKKRKKKKKAKSKDDAAVLAPKDVGPQTRVVKVKFSNSENINQHPLSAYSIDSQQIVTSGVSPSACRRKAQRVTIQRLMNQSVSKGYVVGEKWYLLVYKWWDLWCKYVNYNDRFDELSLDDSAKAPRAINNKALLQVGPKFKASSKAGSDDFGGPLSKDLAEGKHFVFIPVEVWKALFDWYGGGPVLARYVCERHGNPFIELYPELKQINSQPTSFESGAMGRVCAVCSKPNAKICSACQMIAYCSKTCQKAHWVYHSSDCTKGGQIFEGLRGKVGLLNLGNTCYMNSALQCLSHTIPLKKHFITDAFKNDINISNVLGTGGDIAFEYSHVLKALWFGRKSYIVPGRLKDVISHHNQLFEGREQHDSQELMAYIIDALHEDLNLVKEKQNVENTDARGRSDTDVAAEIWRNNSLRNQSIIVDQMQGQFKSTVSCPNCNEVSVAFDLFKSIQLEIPSITRVTVKYVPFVSDRVKDPVLYDLKLTGLSVYNLTHELSSTFGHDKDSMVLTSVRDGNIIEVYGDSDQIQPSAYNYSVYEVPNRFEKEYLSVHVRQDGAAQANSDFDDSDPYIFVVQPSTSQKAIIKQVVLQLLYCSSIGKKCSLVSDIDEMQIEAFCVDIATKMVYLDDDTESYLSFEYSDDKIESLNVKDGLPLVIAIKWSENSSSSPKLSYIIPEHLFTYKDMTKSFSSTITLSDCINKFTHPEMLDEDNRWACQACQSSHRATKTLEIWHVPNILILSLKRFYFGSSYRRLKVSTFVDFPLDGFDMSPFCLSSGDEKPILYDLYAVSNHHGGSLSSGHYTAFARDLESSEDGWFAFNDSNVTSVRPQDVKLEDAYILFYQLRK